MADKKETDEATSRRPLSRLLTSCYWPSFSFAIESISKSTFGQGFLPTCTSAIFNIFTPPPTPWGRIDAHLPATASYIDDDDDCSHLIYSGLAGGQRFIKQLKQGEKKIHVGGAFRHMQITFVSKYVASCQLPKLT